MKRKILLFFAACYAAVLSAGTVNYTADNSTKFANPERGFLHQCTRHSKNNAGNYNAVKGRESSIQTHMDNDNVSLILVLYYLDEFNNTATLPQAVFEAFEEDMEILRQKGLKAIFRIAYAEDDNGLSGSDRSAHDAPLSIIESHLSQYKPYWEANADVIFTFQAGFVGQYGEWYYTDNFGNHVSKINANCKALLDTALKAIPQNRTLLLRRPMFKQQYMDSLHVSHEPLTAEEAYTGTPKARLGHFNDAFLYNDDNMGTYSTNEEQRATQKALIAQETLYVPLGGETDITDATQAANQASHDSTVAEMSTMHWTFIKNTYSETVTNMWRDNGTFDELNRNMGYRYQLVSSTLPDAATAGSNINVNLQIKNVGYAPLYNERHAYIVLKNAHSTYALQLETDPRTWLPNGVTTTIEEAIALPADMPTGKYQLYLYMPDIYPSIADDPRYAVRFANTNAWNEAIGMNRLKATIDISSEVPAVALDTVSLPGTLNKSNVADYFEDTWIGANKDYYDFGSSSGANTDRWVEWKVDIEQAGKYVLTEVFDVPTTSNGHEWRIDLLDASRNKVDSFNTTRVWRAGEERIEPTKWIIRKPGKYTLRVTNAFGFSKPKLKSLKFDYFGPVSSDTITLPATLTKANVADYSDDMTWYTSDPDYFDFGPTDAQNFTRWARWNIDLKYPLAYTVSVVVDFPNGHGWELNLFNGTDTIATYKSENSNSEKEITYTKKWDLAKDKEGNDLVAGKYTLEVKNKYGWAQPKLKSLTLSYDGVLPTGIDQTMEAADNRMYDILGRPVDDTYHGIVIMKGKKILR